MKTNFTLVVALLFVHVFSFGQIRYLKANLQGSQEVPANASPGSGVAIVKYNTVNKYLQLWGNYQNVTTAINASHIHSPGAIGVNAPVLITLTNTGGTSGSLAGTATLTPAQEADLLAGNMYVNVHNATYPGGEIRGQLSTTTLGQTEHYNARLQGAQQVPPNGSAGSGTVNVLLDKVTDSVFLTGNYTGLTTAANASHIHRGPANANGAVFQNLNFTAATSGTLNVAAPIAASDKAEMLAGNSYVNIHNVTFPGGEIRGQLNQYSQIRFLKATMNAAQEVPTNASPGIGTIIVRYNTNTGLLELTGDYQNVTAPITASHIHSPAAPGSNAPVLFNLTNTGGTSGTLTGSAVLTVAQQADLFAGLMYVNVHNANFPGGEIRGQLSLTTAGETQYFTGVMQGSQEVPPTASTAIGNVTAILDKGTNQVYVTASFSGLTANATAAHIHQERAGVNGPVVVNLSPTLSTSGTITGSATVTPAFATEMINGNTYVNIHNASFPGGEIRAQLGNQVLPVRLTYFNGYKDRNNVSLVWESAQEVNLSRYEVEQQTETGTWITRATAPAIGGDAPAKYKVNDAPLASKGGFVFYRLKMVDKDGKFTYSQVIKLNFRQSQAELTLLANPVFGNEVKFTITGLNSDKKAEISIVDMNGRALYKATTSTLMTNAIPVAQLSAGMYKLVVRLDDQVLQQTFSK